MAKVSFDKGYANKVSKADFIKQHEHHADDVDLGEAWEGLQQKKVEAPAAADKKKKTDSADL